MHRTLLWLDRKIEWDKKHRISFLVKWGSPIDAFSSNRWVELKKIFQLINEFELVLCSPDEISDGFEQDR